MQQCIAFIVYLYCVVDFCCSVSTLMGYREAGWKNFPVRQKIKRFVWIALDVLIAAGFTVYLLAQG